MVMIRKFKIIHDSTNFIHRIRQKEVKAFCVQKIRGTVSGQQTERGRVVESKSVHSHNFIETKGSVQYSQQPCTLHTLSLINPTHNPFFLRTNFIYFHVHLGLPSCSTTKHVLSFTFYSTEIQI